MKKTKLNLKKIDAIVNNKGKELLGEAFEGMNVMTSLGAVNKIDTFSHKNPINETAPLGAMDKRKFIKYFDLMLKTAGSNPDDIRNVVKRAFGLRGRELQFVADAIASKVASMTGEE